MNKRQKQIIDFAKKNHSFKNKDLVSFFDDKYSRETITRDLSFLSHQNFLQKSGAGAFVTYSLSEVYKILGGVDIKKYFEIPYLKRDIRESFNFKEYLYFNNHIDLKKAQEKDINNVLSLENHIFFKKI